MKNIKTYFLLTLFFIALQFFAQNKKVDSLKAVISASKMDTNKVKTLYFLAFEYTNLGVEYSNQTLILANKILTLGKQINYSKAEYYYNDLIREVYNKKDFSDTTILILENVAKYFATHNYKQDEGNTYANCAMLYYNTAFYSKSLEYFLKALKINEELNNKKNVAGYMGNIGAIYNSLENNEKALEFYTAALKINEDNKYNQSIAINLVCIGNIYAEIKDYVLAEEYMQKALIYNEQLKNKSYYANNLLNLGKIKSFKNDTIQAQKCFNKALSLYKDINDSYGIVSTLYAIGCLYAQTKNQKTEKVLLEVIEMSKTIKDLNNQKGCYYELSKWYYSQGNFKKSADTYLIYSSIKDSIYTEFAQETTLRMQLEFDFEKKEALQKAEQDKKDILAKEELKKQTLQRNGFIIGFVLMLLLTGVVFRSYRNKQKVNKIISEQKTIVEQQKHVIEDRHKEITDSINYAERIQRSFLATKEMLDSNLNFSASSSAVEKSIGLDYARPDISQKETRPDNYFVFFKPKDVVSGDFYWAANIVSSSAVENFAIATADSTGHGVPGAIMSLLNITSLEKAIETHTQPHEILNATRKIIIERLKRDGSAEGGKDGMDCSLCVFDFVNMKLQIAAANNPVWIVRNRLLSEVETNDASVASAPLSHREVIEIKPDKMPVGKHDKQDIPFTLHEIQLQKGDVIYTLTDGFSDQFGGENNKKFMSKNLRELLAKNAHLPMQEQKVLLETTFKNWIGNAEQVDDVTVIGVKI